MSAVCPLDIQNYVYQIQRERGRGRERTRARESVRVRKREREKGRGRERRTQCEQFKQCGVWGGRVSQHRSTLYSFCTPSSSWAQLPPSTPSPSLTAERHIAGSPSTWAAAQSSAEGGPPVLRPATSVWGGQPTDRQDQEPGGREPERIAKYSLPFPPASPRNCPTRDQTGARGLQDRRRPRCPKTRRL